MLFISGRGTDSIIPTVLWIGQTLWLNHAAAQRAESGQDLLAQMERLELEEVALRQMAITNVKFADILLFLAEILPERTFLVKSISIDQQTGIEFSLTGGNQQKVNEVIQQMNKNSLFRDVSIDRAVNENDGFTVYFKGKVRNG